MVKSGKIKRAVAIALATTMVLGSSFTALADNSGTVSGNGTNEGHVDKKVTNVVLPTVGVSDTTFNYIMDPERLISATAKAKYPSATFPVSANDTGVYFATATDTYDSESNALTVENHSSHSVDLTVKVELEKAATDIALTGDKTLAGATEAQLYLGLVVGSEDEVAVTGTTPAEVTVTIDGKEDNFEVQYTGGEYKYAEKAGATGWETSEFKMTGACTADIPVTADTTAPALKVTWSWSEDQGPSIESADILKDGEVSIIKVNLGTGAKAATEVVSVKYNGNEFFGSAFTWNAEDKTLRVGPAASTALIEHPGPITITFDNDETVVVTLKPEA